MVIYTLLFFRLEISIQSQRSIFIYASTIQLKLNNGPSNTLLTHLHYLISYLSSDLSRSVLACVPVESIKYVGDATLLALSRLSYNKKEFFYAFIFSLKILLSFLFFLPITRLKHSPFCTALYPNKTL